VPVELPKQQGSRQLAVTLPASPLAAAERETGLSRATLLDWERRYGFPCPTRDPAGRRQYPADQIQRLRSIREALEAGHSPDQVVSAGDAELARLANMGSADPDGGPNDTRRRAIERLVASDVVGLRDLLEQALAQRGLGGFVQDVVAPLNIEVGDAWMQGRLEIFQEHLYTETVQGLLRHALHGLPATGPGRPVVLLATASGEGHGLGLLMAEAVLRLAGCHCISLGLQTPLWDLVRAAAALEVDVLALGYTGAAEPGRVAEELAELRRKLPGEVELWAGGSSAVLRQRTIDGLRVVPDLGQAARAAEAWRHRRGPAPAGARFSL
jgi:DNA-binding transcriptional MerR regulator/methylmalonyl-CoA mutase cobalamin-binding subunit